MVNNDYTPLENDSMMEELRAIRDEIGRQAWTMSPEERSDWYNRESERILREQGYAPRPGDSSGGLLQIVRVSPED